MCKTSETEGRKKVYGRYFILWTLQLLSSYFLIWFRIWLFKDKKQCWCCVFFTVADLCCGHASTVLEKGIKVMHLYFSQKAMNLIMGKKQMVYSGCQRTSWRVRKWLQRIEIILYLLLNLVFSQTSRWRRCKTQQFGSDRHCFLNLLNDFMFESCLAWCFCSWNAVAFFMSQLRWEQLLE